MKSYQAITSTVEDYFLIHSSSPVEAEMPFTNLYTYARPSLQSLCGYVDIVSVSYGCLNISRDVFCTSLCVCIDSCCEVHIFHKNCSGFVSQAQIILPYVVLIVSLKIMKQFIVQNLIVLFKLCSRCFWFNQSC